MLITSVIQSLSFFLFKIYFCIKDIARKTLASSEAIITSLKIRSFLINHRLQARQTKRNMKFLFLLLEPSISLNHRSSIHTSWFGHSNASLTTFQQKLATAHCKKICSVLHIFPHNMHSIGPTQFLFLSHSAD